MTKRYAGMLVGASLLLGACGTGEEPKDTSAQGISWEEFQAQAVHEPESDVYVVNGDEAYEGIEGLRAFYDNNLRTPEYMTATGELCVYRSGGTDIKWSASAALNITYCVSTKFGSNYSKVVNAMNVAAAAWEGTGAKVNFVHVSSQDSNCTSRNTSVVFDVNPTSSTQYLARAFFPNASRRSRNVLISTSSFGNIAPWTLDGVLRHELGHTLGFRHEHTRPEAGTCFEDTAWRALTAYDSSSVMHYPQCNGTQNGDLVLTSMDTSGARSLYP